MINPLYTNQKIPCEEDDWEDMNTKKVKYIEDVCMPLYINQLTNNGNLNMEVEHLRKTCVVSYKAMVTGENSKDRKEEDQTTEGIWEVKRSEEALRIEEKKCGKYDCPKIILSNRGNVYC